MKTNTVGSDKTDNAVVSELIGKKKCIGIEACDEDGGQISRLGALVLVLWLLVCLAFGVFVAWLMTLATGMSLTRPEDYSHAAAVAGICTGLAFVMTPTFGNARRVKTLFTRTKRK